MSETSTEPDVPQPREAFAAFRQRPSIEQLLVAVITAMGIALTTGTLYFAYVRPIVRIKFAVLFFGVGICLYYLSQSLALIENPTDASARSRMTDWMSDRQFGLIRRIDAVVCVVSAVAGLAAGYYTYSNYMRLSQDAIVFGFNNTDLYVGLVVIALTIDATRRAYGWSISLVALASVLYALYGESMPGFLAHPGFSLTDIVTFGAMRISGAFSFIMEVGATWVAVFIMFAGLARAYGALDFILGLGEKLGNNLRSGVVHIAVISSMAMGSITGSAAANTATTGSFTIPMMKRQGVRKDYAAAIESVASSGGQIMPPVMGVAAFLMADIIGVSYVRIIQAALIPAVLFYFSAGIAVQFAVLRFGWTTERVNEGGILGSLFSLETMTSVFYFALAGAGFYFLRMEGALVLVTAAATGLTLAVVRLLQAVAATSGESVTDEFFGAVRSFFGGAHFGIPMGVLLVTLVVQRLSPMAAGLYTILALVGTMIVRDQALVLGRAVRGSDETDGESSADERSSSYPEEAVRKFALTGYTTLKGFKDGALDMTPLVGVLAAMGVIISMFTQTGLTSEISVRMVSLGGGVLLVVLILAMITSILFGLGMPTPAAYILVATLLTAPLQDLGVAEITAHLFVFYFAMLSAITPPVAVAVAVGSRIADSGFMSAAKQALRIGAAGFLIPFALVANDSLVNWSLTATPIATFAVFVGVVALTAVTIGYDGWNVLSLPRRFVYLVLSFTAMYAPALSYVLGDSMAIMVQVAAAVLALGGFAISYMGRSPAAVASAAQGRE
ncbi:TRAP transporter fused permease subunit [Natrinema sp. 1APR25-10V2]|uniref:TRAP transporter permease n=1 Tax=Natrinema sp. 1APR25-10V2 TaxID=2951081 RepID=UPI002873F471|nr:TRAP transporter fused permease subunit [Natrinema sp. 1APR25-10V2]MDS0478612.1 TRAP transporter fused permease subunit [Natrinema sp. 1APR25-10V2]